MVIYAVQSCTYTVHILTCITGVGLLSPDEMSLSMRVVAGFYQYVYM